MTTIALEQVRQHLGLKQAVKALDNSLDTVASKQLTYQEMLVEPLKVEVSVRRESHLSTRTKLAHLPFQRTLEQFDYSFQPSIDERVEKGEGRLTTDIDRPEPTAELDPSASPSPAALPILRPATTAAHWAHPAPRHSPYRLASGKSQGTPARSHNTLPARGRSPALQPLP